MHDPGLPYIQPTTSLGVFGGYGSIHGENENIVVTHRHERKARTQKGSKLTAPKQPPNPSERQKGSKSTVPKLPPQSVRATEGLKINSAEAAPKSVQASGSFVSKFQTMPLLENGEVRKMGVAFDHNDFNQSHRRFDTSSTSCRLTESNKITVAGCPELTTPPGLTTTQRDQ